MFTIAYDTIFNSNQINSKSCVYIGQFKNIYFRQIKFGLDRELHNEILQSIHFKFIDNLTCLFSYLIAVLKLPSETYPSMFIIDDLDIYISSCKLKGLNEEESLTNTLSLLNQIYLKGKENGLEKIVLSFKLTSNNKSLLSIIKNSENLKVFFLSK